MDDVGDTVTYSRAQIVAYCYLVLLIKLSNILIFIPHLYYFIICFLKCVTKPCIFFGILYIVLYMELHAVRVDE